MQTKLVLVALAASVSANVNYMAAMNVARDGANLFPRQTIDSKCLSAAQQIASSMPTPPPAIISELTEHPQTDPCNFSIPSSLTGEFSSYASQLQSFASKNKDLLDACTALSQYNTITGCSTTVTMTSSPSGSAASGATAGSQTSSTKNAGARETGMAMAAVAAAGFAFAAI